VCVCVNSNLRVENSVHVAVREEYSALEKVVCGLASDSLHSSNERVVNQLGSELPHEFCVVDGLDREGEEEEGGIVCVCVCVCVCVYVCVCACA
jgi:hypothetical protein